MASNFVSLQDEFLEIVHLLYATSKLWIEFFMTWLFSIFIQRWVCINFETCSMNYANSSCIWIFHELSWTWIWDSWFWKKHLFSIRKNRYLEFRNSEFKIGGQLVYCVYWILTVEYLMWIQNEFIIWMTVMTWKEKWYQSLTNDWSFYCFFFQVSQYFAFNLFLISICKSW